MKKILPVLLITVCILSGCGHKSNSELVDVEQFRCQDSIETVFDVLGETDMETSSLIGDYYEYENLNLWGYDGYVNFRVRDDKKTISKFECTLTLNDNEFEDLLSYFSDKYGSYKVSTYTNQTAYTWEFTEDEAEELGYNRLSIGYYGDKKYIVDFSDQWSIYKDEAYYKYLEEKEDETNTTVIDTFSYEYDDSNNLIVSIQQDTETNEISVVSYGTYDNSALMIADWAQVILYPMSSGIDVGFLSTVGDDSYMYMTDSGSIIMNTISDSATDEYFPEEYKNKFEEMRNQLIDFYAKYGITNNSSQ